ncbi:MAG: DUF4434 domain-containing protein [Clostridia bacterium]|nr:DUF4434 domain-containing protein [Clostridia bacterium]
MKKHIFPIFLSILLPFSAMLYSCSTESEEASTPESESEIAIAESETVNEETTSDTSDTASEEASDNTSSDVSDESDEAIKNEPIIRPTDYPTLCGSFMQATMFKDYSYDRMKAHLQNMYDVGIDILIVQWTFETTSDGVKSVLFDDSFGADEKTADFDGSGSATLETILKASEEIGIKVFIGLNDNAEWWQKSVTDKNWIEQQSKLGLDGAKQMHEKYKTLYPNAFYGWYFVFEFYNMQAPEQLLDNAAYLLNLYRDGLYGIDPEMPMMLSPYISASGASPDDTQKLWTRVFGKTNFRSGDIFCCQDSVGAGHITIDRLDAYYSAIKNAVDTKAELRFWANNECFTQSDWTTAPLDRFVEQMNISSKYVEAHITFAYSHYANPDTGKTGYHLAYKKYYETGKIPESILKKPEITFTSESSGATVKISGSIQNPDKTLMGVRIYKDGEMIKLIDLSAQYGKPSYDISLTDYNLNGSGKAKYSVCGVDYYNNDGEAVEFEVDFKGKNGKNVAIGKAYSILTPPEANYPDEDGKALTDGIFGKEAYWSPEWVGFLTKPEIVIDLGKTEKSIYAIEVNTLGGGNAAVYAPTEITVFVSDDGKNFKQVSFEAFSPDLGVDSQKAIMRGVMLGNEASGRYVKIAIGTNQSWIFIDEISIYAE